MSKGQGRGKTEQMALKTITGYILEVPSRKDDESDDEEDDEDDNWLDYSEMKTAFSQGNFIPMTKKPQYGRVKIKDHQGQTHAVYGRFVLTDPWWDLTVCVDHRNRVKGVVEYALRSDPGIRQHQLIPLMLNKSFQQEAKDTNAVMTAFENFTKKEGLQNNLSFDQLDSTLWRFAHADDFENHKALTKSALGCDTLQSVFRSQRYPQLLHFLGRLFPLNFLNCLLRPLVSVLPELQEATRVEPWIFGFSKIMVDKFKVYGVEATYKAFLDAVLMQHIPQVERDALYIYEVLKTDAVRDGHTYISFPDLRQHWRWAQIDYMVSEWSLALNFLSKNAVTVEERFDVQRNIFLHHNWKAEVDIADGLKTVMNRGIMGSKPAWDVDFSSPHLDCLRGDSDQWQAAQKLTASPVCIMSGKGGCGKTTVVTQLLQHVCLRDSVDTESEFLETSWKDDQDSDDTLSLGPADCNALDESLTVTSCQAKHKGASSSSCSQASVTPEQVSHMIDAAVQSLKEKQERSMLEKQQNSKADHLVVELTADLIRYMGTSGDTALSKTAAGQTMLLLAPTGKAAKLLGNKAKMESGTLHHVIYSYRAFVKSQYKKKRQEEAAVNDAGKGENGGSKEIIKKISLGERHTGQGAADKKNSSNILPVTDTAWKYADTEVLVVDECSLVSLRLFATLLRILTENTPLHKVILLGDVRQLPSIEPGNFLSDVFNTFKEQGLSVELSNNHRSESELIVSNATRISNSKMPFFDSARHFHFCRVARSKDSVDPERDAAVRQLLQSHPELSRHESSQFVAFRRAHCDAINELCCKFYNDHSTHSVAEGSKPRRDFRIGDKVCFRKNGQVHNHTRLLRGYLTDFPEILETFGITKPKDKKQLQRQGGKGNDLDVSAVVAEVLKDGDDHNPTEGFQHTDYVVETTDLGIKMECAPPSADPLNHPPSEDSVKSQRRLKLGDSGAGEHSKKNHWNPVADEQILRTQPEARQEEEDEEEKARKLKDGSIRLCNGEVFFIMDELFLQDESSKETELHRYLVLSDRDPQYPRVVCCSFRALMGECRMCHSWARTIHTYQGSESDIVVYYVGESKVQNLKHVYTAVTRGRKAVFIVGEMENLHQAVSKKSKPRRSRLGHRLTAVMKEVDFSKLHTVVRQINSQALMALNTSTPNSTSAASQATPMSTPPSSWRQSIDSFPDSDDSWIKNMSPADYEISEEILHQTAGPSATSGYREPEGYTDKDAVRNSPGMGGIKERGKYAEAMSPSPTKRQHSVEFDPPTPTKRTKPINAVDSIVTPVKRNLRI